MQARGRGSGPGTIQGALVPEGRYHSTIFHVHNLHNTKALAGTSRPRFSTRRERDKRLLAPGYVAGERDAARHRGLEGRLRSDGLYGVHMGNRPNERKKRKGNSEHTLAHSKRKASEQEGLVANPRTACEFIAWITSSSRIHVNVDREGVGSGHRNLE